MTEQHRPRLRVVKLRMTGDPEDVDAVAERIAQVLPAGIPSRPYPSRHDSGTVRVYMEVSPE